jgi:hypothetical protein
MYLRFWSGFYLVCICLGWHADDPERRRYYSPEICTREIPASGYKLITRAKSCNNRELYLVSEDEKSP